MSKEQTPLANIPFTGEFGFAAFNKKDNEWYSDAVAKGLLYRQACGEPIPDHWEIHQTTPSQLLQENTTLKAQVSCYKLAAEGFEQENKELKERLEKQTKSAELLLQNANQLETEVKELKDQRDELIEKVAKGINDRCDILSVLKKIVDIEQNAWERECYQANEYNNSGNSGNDEQDFAPDPVFPKWAEELETLIEKYSTIQP